jgi:hypothetical protein
MARKGAIRKIDLSSNFESYLGVPLSVFTRFT